jgi:hypothetical protein
MFKVRNLFAVGFLSVLGTVSLSACMVEVDEAVDDETFTRTIVHLNDDGTEVVTVETVTLQEQLAELEEEELRRQGEYEGLGTARNAIMNVPCGEYTMTLWDKPGFTGNQICFTGTGLANLSTYCRAWVAYIPNPIVHCVAWWHNAVRSYKSRSHAGLFWKSHDPSRWCSDECSMFYYDTSQSSASTCEQSGVDLQLGPVTCHK